MHGASSAILCGFSPVSNSGMRALYRSMEVVATSITFLPIAGLGCPQSREIVFVAHSTGNGGRSRARLAQHVLPHRIMAI